MDAATRPGCGNRGIPVEVFLSDGRADKILVLCPGAGLYPTEAAAKAGTGPFTVLSVELFCERCGKEWERP